MGRPVEFTCWPLLYSLSRIAPELSPPTGFGNRDETTQTNALSLQPNRKYASPPHKSLRPTVPPTKANTYRSRSLREGCTAHPALERLSPARAARQIAQVAAKPSLQVVPAAAQDAKPTRAGRTFKASRLRPAWKAEVPRPNICSLGTTHGLNACAHCTVKAQTSGRTPAVTSRRLNTAFRFQFVWQICTSKRDH